MNIFDQKRKEEKKSKVRIQPAPGGGGSNSSSATGLTVKEIDGSPSVSDVSTIRFTNSYVTDDGSNQVTITLQTPDAPTNSIQFNNGGGAFQGEDTFTFDPNTITQQIGKASNQGFILLYGPSTQSLKIQTEVVTTNQILKLPAGVPSATGQFLSVSGISGGTITTAWADITVGLAATQVGFGSAGNILSGSNNLKYVSSELIVSDGMTNIPALSNFQYLLQLKHDTNSPALYVSGFNATANRPPYLILVKGRGSNASPAVVQDADQLGVVSFRGYFGTDINNTVEGASIKAVADGTWSVGNVGAEMLFFTTPNGGSITQVGKWSDKGTFCVAVSPTSDSTTNKLLVGNVGHNTDVVGSIVAVAATASALDTYGHSSMNAGVYIQRWWRQGDGDPRLRVHQDGCVEQRAGASTSDFITLNGTLETNITTVGNVGSGEDNLHTYSLTANSLNEDGDYLEVEYWGLFNTSINNKRIKAYFGTDNYFDTGVITTASTAIWRLFVRIFRLTSSSQLIYIDFRTSLATTGTQQQTNAFTGAQNLASGTITVKITGESTDNDEIQCTTSYIKKGHTN